MPGSSQIPGSFATDDRKCSRTEIGEGGGRNSNWYLPRDTLEADSPSRKDGINSMRENELRKSFCSFLRDLGFRLRVPYLVIATATVLCHRFYLHQSHLKNDRFTIATACMFLASKVEEARRALEEVVFVSYCLQNKGNPLAPQEMKEKDKCEREKEHVVVAEQLVLKNLNFNVEVRHPYNSITGILNTKSTPETLFRVAFIIVNDSFFTTLCLQFEPQHIAASAIYFAAKLVKFNFPQRSWWRDFNVSLRQLEAISIQILELYEQERLPPVHSSSSSSSVDEKARTFSITPDPPETLPERVAHERENGVAAIQNGDLVIVGRESNKSLSKHAQPKASGFDLIAKKRKLDEDSLVPANNVPKKGKSS